MIRALVAYAICEMKSCCSSAVYSSQCEKFMNWRAFLTSLWICIETGGMYEYQGQTVSSEWQSRQARWIIFRTGRGALKSFVKVLCGADELTPMDPAAADISAMQRRTAGPMMAYFQSEQREFNIFFWTRFSGAPSGRMAVAEAGHPRAARWDNRHPGHRAR